MTYFGFLLQFVVVPIVVLGIFVYRDRRMGKALPQSLRLLPPALVLVVLVGIALIYTTPWDNYLVATGVWWYDPALVTGITLGWVPIEEYTFFILQPILTGLWVLFLARRVHVVDAPFKPRSGVRVVSVVGVGAVWFASLLLLLSGWKPGNYLSLELVWALPPIALQLAFGADILWHYRRLVFVSIASATLYLCGMDALAIASGTWTINPELSLDVLLGGVLPVEEAVFFLLTNMLLVFGLVLGLATESAYRLPAQIIGGKVSQSERLTQ
ncbi:MAG TPA: lycopene cyclase domain-containing protein [Oceanobacillus sp.]|nr:lycopene cyclase domain-containing protein [Oceanobacillus sp.]